MTNEDRFRFEAEFLGLTNPDGTLAGQLPAAARHAPGEVWIEDDNLKWRWSQDYSDPPISSDVGMLEAFCRLGDAPPQQILRFVRRWGVLFICEHQLPTTHNPMWHQRLMPQPTLASEIGGCLPLGYFDRQLYEPLAVWRHFARQAQALLKIAMRVHQDQPGTGTDWNTVYEQILANSPALDASASLYASRFHLVEVVNEWLRLGNVRPELKGIFDWPPRIVFGQTLFARLAIQLMAVVSRSGSLAICTSCGTPYLPSRRPTVGKRTYCDECGRPAAVRDAQRRRRERKKGDVILTP